MMNRSAKSHLQTQRISETLQRWPWLYTEIQRFRYRGRGAAQRIVTRKHAIMIEGFPRSGISFAVQAILSANPSLEGRIATHLHTSPHLIRAAKLAVPGMVLIRNPANAVTSMIALGIMNGRLNLDTANEEAKRAIIAHTTERYTAFHRTLFPLRDRLMIVRFEDITTDFGAVIDRFTHRFGTTISRFDHTPKSTAKIFEKTKKNGKIHLSSEVKREEGKQRLFAYYSALANSHNRLEAEKAYTECLTAAEKV